MRLPACETRPSRRLFEARDRIGGHTATYDVQIGTRRFAVDTGFIVYNDRNYPNMIKLFQELGVASKPTSMGFSVCDEISGLEYAGNNLNTLFAQRGNLLSPSFLGMVREILRFNKLALADLDSGSYRKRDAGRVSPAPWFLASISVGPTCSP